MNAVRFTAMLCAALLAAFCLIEALPVRGEEAVYSSTIRLHVLAVSDEAAEQARKMRVRDAVLEVLEAPLTAARDCPHALSLVASLLPTIRDAAEAAAGGVPVTVSLGRERYPTRVYESFALPAGEYTSLRVILGGGEGRNWWCVLFPQLCTARASEDGFYADFIAAGFTPEQYRLIRNESGTRYKIRFRFLEILSDVFGFAY